MRDGYTDLPADDEFPEEIKRAGVDWLERTIGYEALPGDVIDGGLAWDADETAALWAALRQKDYDTFRDQGRAYGIPDPAPTPAGTTVTLTAVDAAGYTLPAGTTLVVRGGAGDVVLQNPLPADVPAGQTTVSAVLFEVADPVGADGNAAGLGATTLDGSLELAAPPRWLAAAALDAPTAGGASALTDEEHDGQIKRAIYLTQQTPTHVDDLELAAQQEPGCARMLVVKGLDLVTGTLGHENLAAGFPIDNVGQPSGLAVKQRVRVRCLGDTRKLLCQRDLQLGDPDYWTIDVDILGQPDDGGVLNDALAAAVQAALTERLQPYNHALPRRGRGQMRRWLPDRSVIRRYEIASAADAVPGWDETLELTLSATGPDDEAAELDDDGNVLMTGWAPLPVPGTVTVQVAS